MYILANIGVIRYYATEKRSEWNTLVHLIFPVIATIEMLFVAYKSIVPLPDPPARYALVFFVIYTAIGGGLLGYLKARGREDWLDRARLAMEETK
jgi:hypothetical protein